MKKIFTLICLIASFNSYSQIDWKGNYQMVGSSINEPYIRFEMTISGPGSTLMDCEVTEHTLDKKVSYTCAAVRQADGSLSIYFKYDKTNVLKIPGKTKLVNLQYRDKELLTTFYYPKQTPTGLGYQKVEKFSY